ncbi:uncharacterized protein SAPINGB_P001139 [Magnusiomyces paraingens]|uniref:HotDog ACOT-type domain-containing protein n=1 Tax=Magnusiomyces paraingens TaxID=2606893 RepID=A0A5E8B483_9ASCO|nr:uncharacterized protein SAPINGB_P001139 [Saprochaete ingens]VVT46288.1 unnamed protein product [Saprochaete ingens]
MLRLLSRRRPQSAAAVTAQRTLRMLSSDAKDPILSKSDPTAQPNPSTTTTTTTTSSTSSSTSTSCSTHDPTLHETTQFYGSPLKRTTTWLQAFRAREQKHQEWLEKNKDDILAGRLHPHQFPLESYSYQHVVTEKVTKKSPKDSFSYTILPFKSDEWFLDGYINAFGRLRIGQLFQDLDSLAGIIAYRHCSPALPVIVTASVDRVFMKKRLDKIADYNVSLSGNVTWTGRSSMEITIKACTHTDPMNRDTTVLTPDDVNESDVFLTANFTFVARHPTTKRSFPINHVVPETPDELREFVRAEKYNTAKKEAAQKTSLNHRPPSGEESRLIHSKWLTTLPGYIESHKTSPQILSTTMAKTRTHSTTMMQPQYRNRHSYMIFGGYLLRETFELAYSCSAAFAHASPRFVSLDETTFRNPVPVGSVLYLTATVVYTEFINRKQNPEAGEPSAPTSAPLPNSGSEFAKTAVPGTLIQVRVDSLVRDINHGTTTNTGSFVFSFFAAAQAPGAPVEAPAKYYTIVPETYAEMMEYLEGRRLAIETANFNTYVRMIPSGEVVSE